MRFDCILSELEQYARWHYGPSPAVAVLEVSWADRAPFLFGWGGVPSSAGSLAPEISLADGRLSDEDWYGDLELWPATPHRVLLRRLAIFSDGRTHVTLAAAPRREHIDRAVTEGTALWRRWRREQQLATTGTGRRVEAQPVAWDELCLPATLLDDVRTTALAFAASQERYRSLRLPYRRGLLFQGPPGNGKTMLCRAIVTALGWPVIYFDGESNDYLLARVFDEATELAPCVVCFEDVDSLFAKGARLSSFLNRLDGFDADEGLLVLATTNHPDKLDPAITSRPSRFDRVYAVDDPDRAQRERYLRRLFASAPLADEQLAELAADTDGMSMAFLKEVFVGATLRAAARDAEAPDAADVRATLPALLGHRKDAARAFQTVRATGFTARPS